MRAQFRTALLREICRRDVEHRAAAALAFLIHAERGSRARCEDAGREFGVGVQFQTVFDHWRGAFARFAGANIWCESGDVTYIGRNYVTFHASSAGRKTLHLPVPCEVWEVYENKCMGENVTDVSFEVYFGETKMFRIIEK